MASSLRTKNPLRRSRYSSYFEVRNNGIERSSATQTARDKRRVTDAAGPPGPSIKSGRP